jgi:hypothetical protein
MRVVRWVPVLAALVLAAPAAASSPGPLLIDDPAGDAHVVHPGAVVLPFGGRSPGTPSDPSADLLAVTVSSDAGTALVVRFDLSGDPTASVPLGFGLDAVVGGCDSRFAAFPSDAPTGGGVVRWMQYGDTCPVPARLPGWGTTHTDPRWTVTTGPASVELRIPLDALDPAQAAVLRLGATLVAPSATTTTYTAVGASPHDDTHTQAVVLDRTAVGRDWVLGEDAAQG